MQAITIHDAKTNLSRYLAATEQGDSFIIMRGRQPVAKLVPLKTGPDGSRPKVGEMLDVPIAVPDAAYEPLTSAELKKWGLG